MNKLVQIGDKTIQIQGTVENPLFNAQEVIQSVLEYKQLEDCRFYKDNKSNPLFISRIDDQNLTGKTPDRYLGFNRYSNTTIYLTEFGLYECLFSSNKLIAAQFRIEVMTLLRDIRNGNLNLLVQQECESTKLIQENKNSLIGMITEMSNLQDKVTKLKNRLEQCSEVVYIYEKVIVSTGEKYRGVTNNLKVRNDSHKSKSSCQKLKKAYEDGLQVDTFVLASARVYNNDEKRYFEQQFIINMQAAGKLNVKTPYPNSFETIAQDHIQNVAMLVSNHQRIPLEEYIIKYNINIDESQSSQEESKQQVGRTIEYKSLQPEDYQEYLDQPQQDAQFKERILDIKEFIQTYKFTPRDSKNVSEQERSLAQMMVKIRNAVRTQSTKNVNLTPERYIFIKTHTPEILIGDNDPFFEKVLELKAFYETNNRWPKQRNNKRESTPQLLVEYTIYDWMAHKRTDYKQNKLNQECIDFMTEQIPDFEWVQLTDDQKFERNLNNLKQFYQIHNRNPLQKENKQLQCFVKTLLSADKHQSKQSFKLTPERKQMILTEIPAFKF